jgi:hypothetical protein
MNLPMSSVELRSTIAASASSVDSIVTKPNPRDSRVCGSYMTEALLTCGRGEQQRKNPGIERGRGNTGTHSTNFSKRSLQFSSINFMMQPRNVEVISRVGVNGFTPTKTTLSVSLQITKEIEPRTTQTVHIYSYHHPYPAYRDSCSYSTSLEGRPHSSKAETCHPRWCSRFPGRPRRCCCRRRKEGLHHRCWWTKGLESGR